MKPITLAQIRDVVGGKAISRIPDDVPPIGSISTDTRSLQPGALFVALKGPRFDAHSFLSDAASRGAIAALVEEPPPQLLPNVHLVQVQSTRASLGRLATFVRSQFCGKVIAVAGSNGKTGTKHLIDSALSGKLRGSTSPKSFNNDIGVPLTIFPADPSQDYLVLELGTNHPGEIRNLTAMARPDIAVITNCGPEHLEFLGDLMGVRQENAAIIEGLDPNGCLVVNGDDDDLLEAISIWPRARRATFGYKPTNDLFATDIQCDQTGVRYLLNGRRPVTLPLLGRHTACNSLAAIAVARRMGLAEDQIIQSLAVAHGPEMRLQLRRINGIDVLNDAYNANPASMAAALETLAALPAPRRRIAVLGDMKELGPSSDRYHLELGSAAASASLDALICIGEKAALIAQGAKRAGFAGTVEHYSTSSAAIPHLRKSLHKGDLVLLKASRSMRLEEIAAALASGGDRRVSLAS